MMSVVAEKTNCNLNRCQGIKHISYMLLRVVLSLKSFEIAMTITNAIIAVMSTAAY